MVLSQTAILVERPGQFDGGAAFWHEDNPVRRDGEPAPEVLDLGEVGFILDDELEVGVGTRGELAPPLLRSGFVRGEFACFQWLVHLRLLVRH